MDPKVSIVILNWNGWEDTLECLESLFKIDYENYTIIIVDNGSTDDSIDKIREYCYNISSFDHEPLNNKVNANLIEVEENDINLLQASDDQFVNRIFLIKNKDNHGFAEGSNIGIKFALNLNSDYVLLLNNDTVVERNFLSELVKVAEKNKDIGVIGPVNYFYDKPDEIQFLSATIDLKRGTIKFHLDRGLLSEELVETDYVQGSCLMIRSNIIHTIGLLDPDYFCYWEETDYCMRVKRAGFRVVCCTSSSILHKGSKSTLKMPGFMVYYLTRNKFLFLRSHSQRFYEFLVYFFLFGFWWDLMGLIKNKSSIIPFIKGVWHGLFHFKNK